MPTDLTDINLAQLYRGYVLSSASLDIPLWNQETNGALLTHKVLSYFAGLGRSLGFAPWSESGRRDLEWWSHSKLVLHLACESEPSQLEETVVRKLATSRETKYRFGILFSEKGPNEMKVLLYANRQNLAEALLVTTYWKQRREAPEDKGEREKFLVTGHLVRENKVAELPRACLVLPKQGPVHMYFPDEGDWE